MSLPRINLNDGRHKMIVAEEGERVLTPSQNSEYEASHPDARMKPMQAQLVGHSKTGVYDGPGGLGSVGGGYAPDQALVAAKSEGTTAGAVQPGMVRSDSDLAAKGFQSNQGTVAGQGDVGGKHVPIKGQVNTHTSNDDPLLDVSHPQSQLQWAYDKGGAVQTPLGARIADRAKEIYAQYKGKTIDPTTPQGMGVSPSNRPSVPMKGSLLGLPMTGSEGSPKAVGVGGRYSYTGEPTRASNEFDTGHPALDEEKEKFNTLSHDDFSKWRNAQPRPIEGSAYGPAGEDNSELTASEDARRSAGLRKIGEEAVYDDGGTVPTNDDHLKEAAQRQAEDEVMNNTHIAEHSPGARADVAYNQDSEDAKMRKYPAPGKPVSLQYDNEKPVDPSNTEHIYGDGVSMGMDNALSPPKMNMNSAPVTQDANPTLSEASAKTPLGPKVATPQSAGMKPLPMQVAPEAPKPAAEVTAPDPMEIVQQDKLAAMKKGTAGLTDLGTSLIHEKALMPKYTGKGADEVPQGEPIVAEDKKAFPAMQHQEFEDKRKDYDRRIQAAMDLGTPEGDREAASLQLAKSHFDKANPYGSAANHPGILGKLGHIAARVGEGALDAYAGPNATATLIPGSPEERRVRETEYRGQRGEGTKEGLEQAQAHQAMMGSKLPPTTQVFDDLKGQVNPDTGGIYTDQERLDIAQNPGKAGEVTYARKYQKDNPGKSYEEGVAEYHKMLAGNKMNEHEKRVADYVSAHNMEDTPANRETARIAIETADVDAKQIAALPFAEQKIKFSSNLAIVRNRLQQNNADANTRGLEADKLQNTENARYDKVHGAVQMAQDTLKSSDDSQFAANIVPIVTLLTTTTEAGVKRVNKQELDKFLPADGSLGRWASAHADKWMAGEIPPEYRNEVGEFLTRLAHSENAEHTINSHSIDTTVRTGGQEPVQTKTGGASATPKPSTSKAPEEVPASVPKTATHVYRDKQNKVVGYADGGVYHAIKK